MKSFSSEIDDKQQETTIADFDKAKQIEQQERVRIKIASIRDANEKIKQEQRLAFVKEQAKARHYEFMRARDAYVNEKLKHQPENELVFKGDRRSYEDHVRKHRRDFLDTPKGKDLKKEYDEQQEKEWSNCEKEVDDVIQKQNEQEMVEQRRSQIEQQYEEARQRASEAFERASQREGRNQEKGKDLGIEIE